MRQSRRFLWTIGVLVLASATPGQRPDREAAPRGAMFDAVVTMVDERFSTALLDKHGARATASRSAALARRVPTLAGERAVTFDWLARIPVSHLGLLSRYGHALLEAELSGKPMVTLGFQVLAIDGGHYVIEVLEGGVAARAGIVRGDRVLAIDGMPTALSARLDQRTDDAWLDDPPRHWLRVDSERPVRLLFERRPGERFQLALEPTRDSAAAADARAVHVVERAGCKLGYLPLSYMYHDHAVPLVVEALNGPLRRADGLLLDLRGRGGSPTAAAELRALFSGRRARWRRPVVVLVDRLTRSAKEVLAYDLRRDRAVPLVGERTAGAVRPCVFVNLPGDAVLMVPEGGGRRDPYTRDIELVGLEPDVPVVDSIAYAAGADAILERGLRTLAEACGRSGLVRGPGSWHPRYQSDRVSGRYGRRRAVASLTKFRNGSKAKVRQNRTFGVFVSVERFLDD